MKMLRSILLLFLGTLLSVQARSQKDTTRESVRTKAEWEEALTQAEEEEKLLLLDCVSEWCERCEVMHRRTFTDERVQETMNEHFIKLKIDMEYGFGKVLARKYKVQAFPSFLVFNEDRDLLYRDHGYKASSEFLELLDEATQEEQWMEQKGVSKELKPGFPEFYKASFEPKRSDERETAWGPKIHEYLTDREDLFSEVSWAVMYQFPLPPEFKEHFLEKKERYEELYGSQEVKIKVERTLRSELTKAALEEDSDEADLERILERLKTHYHWEDRQELHDDLIMSWHGQNGNWQAYGEQVIKNFEGKDLQGKGMIVNRSCLPIKEKVKDRELLHGATELMGRAIEENELRYEMANTYAHLLHKTEQMEKAKRWAEKAIEIGKEKEEDTEATEKLLEEIRGEKG